MTITNEQAREWAWEESKRKAPYHRWDEDRTRDFEMMMKVASKPAIIEGLKPSRRDQLLWNMARVFWETARRPGYDAHRVALVSAMPHFFECQFLDLEEQNVPLEMFWDDVCSGIGNADRPLVDAVFDALVRQLAIPNVWCQASAVHGFNHLQEPRCRPILRAFIQECENEHLREYARGAMTFTLM